MKQTGWVMNRVAASIVGAILVGVTAGIIMAVIGALTCGPSCVSSESIGGGPMRCLSYSSSCGNFIPTLLFTSIVSAEFSLVLGTLPGIVALTLTPAKTHPWRSLPILILGTLVGFGIYLLTISHLESGSGISGYAALFSFPTITGLLTAWNIARIPKFSRR